MKRFEWLNMMIKKHNLKYGAEIGTGTGKTGMELLSNNENIHLIQVVYYPKESKLDDASHKAYHLWKKRVLNKYFNRITVLMHNSHEASKYVTDETLDFIFIDADHSYEHCLEDIKDWVPKVKKGGLVSGHDYEINLFPGVVKAVDEYFNNNFELFNCEPTKKYFINLKNFKSFTLTDDRVWYTWKK